MNHTSSKKLSILFLIKRAGTAGIETLLLRKISLLSQLGHSCSLVMFLPWSATDFYQNLPQTTKIYYLCNPLDWFRLAKINFQYLYTFEIIGSIAADLFTSLRILKRTTHCIGVYHPLEYCWTASPFTFAEFVTKKYFLSFPHKNIFFMNEGMKERHEVRLKTNFSASPILPIGVNTYRWKSLKRSPIKNSIVSVGRLEHFKTYNLYVLDAVKALISEGYDITYTIYGNGALHTEVSNKISDLSLSDKVSLCPSIPYSQLGSVFSSAYIFIGCGTALVEAAASKIPALMSIESYPGSLTYGLFSDSIGANLGELNPTQAKYSYYTMLKKLLDLTENEYSIESTRSQQRAEYFNQDNVIQLFISSLQSATHRTPINFRYIFLFWCSFTYWKIKGLFSSKNPLSQRYIEKVLQ